MYIDLKKAIELIKNGKMLILVDSQSRENEGDFVMAGCFCKPEDVNFIISEGKGILCQAIDFKTAKKLNLEPMVNNNTAMHSTNFTISVDAKDCETTGVSAVDRCITINKLAQADCKEDDLLRPGHLFPLIAHKDGIKERQGHTEGVVRLMELSGINPPTGILCEILNKDGTMARRDDLAKVSEQFNIPVLDIKELLEV